MAFLIGMSEGVRGQKFDLQSERTTIGRAATNDIVINDAAASSLHCYIARRGDRYILHDMNSTNGTCLNFDRIQEADLEPKQVIQIGSTEFIFDDDSHSQKTRTATMTKVIADVAPPDLKPKSFSSVSPFGARRRDNKNAWLIGITITAIIALGFIVLFVVKLFK